MNFMRRFSNDLWTGVVCGYFFVFGFEGVMGLVRLIDALLANDPDPGFSLDGAGFILVGVIVNMLDIFAAVQLMRRISHANILAGAVLFLHLAMSTGVILYEWKLIGVISSYLPIFYNLSQMILTVLVLFVLRYLRTNKANVFTAEV
jgi:hypothetical protein